MISSCQHSQQVRDLLLVDVLVKKESKRMSRSAIDHTPRNRPVCLPRPFPLTLQTSGAEPPNIRIAAN